MCTEAILANFGGVMWTFDAHMRPSVCIFHFGYKLRLVSMQFFQDILKKLGAFSSQSCDFYLFLSSSAALEALQLCSHFVSSVIVKFTARLLIYKNL